MAKNGEKWRKMANFFMANFAFLLTIFAISPFFAIAPPHDATALLLPRSSNIAEGWLHGFHSLLSCSNPTIWKFLECLKKEQNLTDVKITKMMMREAPEPRAAKWRRYDERLQAVINNFYDYACVMDFLACVSNMI